MATSYDLIASRPLVKVLTPTTTIPVQVCTIRTKPTGVNADLWVQKAEFDKGEAGPELTDFANAIEAVISQGKAVGGSPYTNLDDNGLQQVYVQFVVAYTPPGAQTAPITTDVNVPVELLTQADAELGRTLMGDAEQLVDDAYANLVAASKG